MTRISNTAQFAGLKLLNGSLSYLTSGVNAAVMMEGSADIARASDANTSTCSVGRSRSWASTRLSDKRSRTNLFIRAASRSMISRNRVRAAASSRAGPRSVSMTN